MSDDVVLRYLQRLREMTDSPKFLADIDEVEGDRIEELAQRRGKRLARRMRADGTLEARSPRRVVNLTGLAEKCAHCGASLENLLARNPGRVESGERVCHPNDDGPDCYRLVTVYHQPLGFLRGQRDLWRGVHKMQPLDDVVRELGIEETP